MAALTQGTNAPDFTLSTTDGKEFSLHDALVGGPVIAVFFKVSCPVCQYTMPFLQRIHQAYGNQNATLIGISQDKRHDTMAFIEEHGVRFPVLLDDTSSYTVSNAYGLTNVPTVFWIAQDGEVEISSVGWSRKDIEEIHRRIGELRGGVSIPLFKPGDDVRDFRAG